MNTRKRVVMIPGGFVGDLTAQEENDWYEFYRGQNLCRQFDAACVQLDTSTFSGNSRHSLHCHETLASLQLQCCNLAKHWYMKNIRPKLIAAAEEVIEKEAASAEWKKAVQRVLAQTESEPVPVVPAKQPVVVSGVVERPAPLPDPKPVLSQPTDPPGGKHRPCLLDADQIPLTALGFMGMTNIILQGAGIRTLAQLMAFTEEELYESLDNFGPVKLRDVVDTLERYNLALPSGAGVA